MSYSQASFTNVNGTNFDFVVGVNASVVAGGVNIRRLGWRYEAEGDEVPKQQDTGNHPAPAYVARVVLEQSGQIVGSGATDELRIADYWARRGALMQAVLVNDGPQVDDFHHGVLKVTPQGGSQMYVNAVLLNANLAGDVEDGSNRMSYYTFVWRVDRGAWRAVSGDAVVKL